MLQGLRQPPQCALLVRVSTSQPLAAFKSQLANPRLHKTAQTPAMQPDTPLVALQTFEHLPQLPGSDLRFVSQPLASLLSQLAQSEAHSVTTHTPCEHAVIELGSAQTLPQKPQLFASEAMLTSHRLAGLPSQSASEAVPHWFGKQLPNTRQELEVPLEDFARKLDPKRRLSASTLSRDLETCLRSYAPRFAGGSPEDFAEPLLGELGLLQEVHKGQYAFRRGPKVTLHDGLFAYALLDFWDSSADGASSMAFETIAYGEGSPGRVFKLDEDSVAERLMSLSDLTEVLLAWTDTAGLRQVHRKVRGFGRTAPRNDSQGL